MLLPLAFGCALAPGLAANDVHVAVVTRLDGESSQRLIGRVPLEVLNEPDQDGNTPLMVAALDGNLDAVTRLLGKDVDARVTNRQGADALTLVALRIKASSGKMASADAAERFNNLLRIDQAIETYLKEEGKAILHAGALLVDEYFVIGGPSSASPERKDPL